MQKVLTAAQMREVDRLTTEKYGIPSILLMENAAHAVARVITEKLGGSVKGKSILVLCGKGNNGGDGAAIARILWSQGSDVDVFLFGRISETSGDARVNFEILKELSERDPPFSPYLFLYENDKLESKTKEMILRSHVIVDAVFGTGLTRPIPPNISELFKHIRIRKKFLTRHPFLISVDLPSGLNADSQADYPDAFDADSTVTFTAPKLANVLAPNHRKNGELLVEQIGSPYELLDESKSDLEIWDKFDVSDWLNRLKFSDASYKNKRGHALLIAGSESYSGAAVLAGNAAMRSGVGLVTIATPKSSKESVASRVLPDVIVHPIGENASGEVDKDTYDANEELIGKADSIAIGCGLSATDKGVEKLAREIVEKRTKPVIIDAGALWFFNPQAGIPPNVEGQLPLILTPHEGEFMRLLGTTDKDAIKDRVAAVREFATKHRVILVLKGERVLIGEPGGKVVVNPTGNSGLGKAGNGDTLTGIIAGFVAQAVRLSIDIFETVVAAVYIAGMAGDMAEKKYGKRVMTASDVRECLTEVFETLEGK